LIPLVDWLLFRKKGTPRLMLNLGGIANVTFLPERFEDVVAFDTGPGNALLDAIMVASTEGAESFDHDGERSVSGTASEDAVEEFLKRPYFSTPPPKSTGKELFGDATALELATMVCGKRSPCDLEDRELADVLATAALVTARSVREAVARFAPAPSEVFVSGGGVHNRGVMEALTELFAPIPVKNLSELGMDPDAKEAVGFAVLANETIAGRAGNVPAATGASAPVVLGKISPGIEVGRGQR
jgi:anhydro-N-acetylmuramic acid kinase